MNEVIATIQTPDEEKGDPYPQGYTSFDRLEIKKQKNGHEAIYGILIVGDTERQVLMPDLAQMWGHDPEDRQRYNQNPEMWHLKHQVHVLTKRVESLESDLAQARLQDPATVLHPEPEPKKQVIRTSESRPRQVWNQTAGRLGDLMLRRQVELHNELYSYLDNRGRRITVEEEVIDGYPESSRRAGAAAIGAVAVGGVVGGLIGYFIGRHTGHDVINHYHTIKTPPSPSHVALYNSAPGYRLTGAELPQKLHLAKDLSGRSIIRDNDGLTVVGHLKDGLFDRQGNLSRPARALLRAKGYILNQLPFGGRYMTKVT
jgi:hypothetical protein